MSFILSVYVYLFTLFDCVFWSPFVFIYLETLPCTLYFSWFRLISMIDRVCDLIQTGVNPGVDGPSPSLLPRTALRSVEIVQ